MTSPPSCFMCGTTENLKQAPRFEGVRPARMREATHYCDTCRSEAASRARWSEVSAPSSTPSA